MASYVVALANSTGWTEHYILWELPLARGYQLMHAILLMNGAKTVGGSIEQKIEEAFKDFDFNQIQEWQPT